MLNIIVIISYLAILFLIGVLSSRIISNTSDFLVANRKLGLLTTVSSLTSTGIGGSATIVAIIYVYTRGLPGIWMNFSAGLGLILLGFTFAVKVRSMETFSLPEIVEKLYDRKARYIASFLIILAEIAWLALVIQATQLIMTSLLNINQTAAIYLSTGIFIVYTILGGQFAVSYSDVFQMFIMFFGILFVASPIVFIKAGGLAGLKTLPGYLLQFPINSKMGVLDVLSLIFLMGFPHLVGPDIYAKILSARDENVARQGALLSGILRIIWGVAIAIIALGAKKLLPNMENPAFVLPQLIVNIFNPYLSGILIAAFIATMMSSADTILLTGSTVLLNDIFSFLLKNKNNLLIIRLFVLLVGILGLLIALYMKDIIKTLELAYTIFSSGLIIPIIAGFYKEKLKVNKNGALASMIGGGGISLLLKLNIIKIFPQINPVLIGMSVSLILMFLGSIVKFNKNSTDAVSQ
ncbi:Sodium/pantothenate symporter [subsurface metagenome]